MRARSAATQATRVGGAGSRSRVRVSMRTCGVSGQTKLRAHRQHSATEVNRNTLQNAVSRTAANVAAHQLGSNVPATIFHHHGGERMTPEELKCPKSGYRGLPFPLGQ